MINLIPNKERKEMTRGFYYRLVVLFFVTLGVSFFIAFIAILPSYFLSSAKNSIIHAKLEMQKNQPVPAIDLRTLMVIENLNNKLEIIKKARDNKFVVSEKVVNAIILKKTPNIKITDITYENDLSKEQGGGVRKISIQGNAPSREALLSFRQALEDDVSFKQVNLPISNFIKGSNIQFYLSLTLQ